MSKLTSEEYMGALMVIRAIRIGTQEVEGRLGDENLKLLWGIAAEVCQQAERLEKLLEEANSRKDGE